MNKRLPLVKVTARINNQNGDPVAGAVVKMRLSTVEKYQGAVIPREISQATDANGIAVLRVFPNILGYESSEYAVTINFPGQDHMRTIRAYAVVPNSDCNLFDILNLPPNELRGAGAVLPAEVAGYAAQASAAADAAHTHANNARKSETSGKASAASASASMSDAAKHSTTAASYAAEIKLSAEKLTATISTSQSKAIEEIKKTAGEISITAANMVEQREVYAIQSINNEKHISIDAVVATGILVKQDALKAVSEGKMEALQDVNTAKDLAIEEFQDIAVQYEEDFSSMTERAESAAGRAGCSASKAASDAKKACECASRVDVAIRNEAALLVSGDSIVDLAVKKAEQYRDEANSLSAIAKNHADCAKTDADRASNMAASSDSAAETAIAKAFDAEEFAVSAMNSMQAAKQSSDAISSHASSMASENNVGHVQFGTTEGTACQGNDSRLNNSRTPERHASSHKTGGVDAITPADIGAAPEHDHPYAASNHNHDTSYAAIGHASSHKTGGVDAITPADIGAAPEHDHPYAASNHNHDTSYAAIGHASSHKTGGVDAITPADIGAAPGGFGLGVLFGAQLPENTDLNAINKPGFYNCRWGINAKTMKNIPADVGGDGFSLLVEGSNYGSAQTLTEHGGVKAIYRRSQTDQNVFSQWVRMPSGITDVITDNADLAISGKAVVSAGYVPKSRKVLVNGKEAGDLSADLDLKVGSGETIGSQKWWDSVKIPNGWVNISKDIGPMPRDAFPQAWEHAKDSQNILSDTDWLAQVAEFGFCGAYSYGDGATTFRFPLIRGAFIRAVDSEKGRGLGTNQGDAIRNLQGSLGWENSGVFQIADGVFKGVPRKSSAGAYGADGVSTRYRAASFDASLVVPTAEENRPANVSYIRILKVYDEEAEPGLVDVQVLISKINEVADLVMSEAHIRKLAGTKEGRVLAWAMIDNSVAPPVIKASGNIASVVREAANGYLAVTFLKPFDTDFYSVTGSGSNGSTPYTAGPVAVQPYALKKTGFSFYVSANNTYALMPNIFIQVVGI